MMLTAMTQMVTAVQALIVPVRTSTGSTVRALTGMALIAMATGEDGYNLAGRDD